MSAKAIFLSFLLFSITACSTQHTSEARLDTPLHKNVIVRNNLEFEDSSKQFNSIEPAAGYVQNDSQLIRASYKGNTPKKNCRLKDRFDRGELIAYNFADGQSRVGLKVSSKGFKLKDAGNFEIQKVGLRFRYRFQDIKKKRERCLYESAWQGLMGSGYNELYRRENDTVYQELDQEFDDIAEKMGKLF